MRGKKTLASLTLGAAVALSIGLAQPANATTMEHGTGHWFASREACEEYGTASPWYPLGWYCSKDRIDFLQWQLHAV